MKKLTGDMSKNCQGPKRLQEERWRYVGDYANQNYSPDCLNEFSQKEKGKIFYNVYSCIDRFYQLVDDKKLSR